MSRSRRSYYEDWYSSQESQTSVCPSATPYDTSSNGSTKSSRPLPFRKRLQSLPLTGQDLEGPGRINTTLGGSKNTSAQDHGRRLGGGIIELLRKASISVKNRHRRHSHVAPLQEVPQNESPWRRLKTATSFNRHSKVFLGTQTRSSENSIILSRRSVGNLENMLPIPGNGNEPPRIPRHSGGESAKIAARIHNDLELSRHRLSPLDALGDRESGIEMAITQSEEDAQQNIPKTKSMVGVDFIKHLPREIAFQILALLDSNDLSAVLRVSKEWSSLALEKSVWRQIFLRDQTRSFATGKPIPQGKGLGLPAHNPADDWKDMYRVRQQLSTNWKNGKCDTFYLNGHGDSIYCVQFDENKIITGSRDKTIRVWDMRTLACTLVIGPPDVINDPSLRVDENNNAVHYATWPNPDNSGQFIRGHDSHPAIISYPMCHIQSILCLQYDEEILVTGSSDSTVIIHDMKSRMKAECNFQPFRPIRKLQYHTAAVLDLTFDKRYIVTCSKDLTICVSDRATGSCLKQLSGHSGPVNAVQLRGNTIVSCSGDFLVKMWDITNFSIIQDLRAHTKGLACSQFSEDSKYIASAGNDKSIRIWNANTYDCIHNIENAHAALVRSLHIDSISGRLISGSYDSSIKVFDMATGHEVVFFPEWHASWVLGAKSDYRHIVSTGQEPKIMIQDFGRGIEGIDRLRSLGPQ
ncbi:hypothetical protein LZ554_000263 [Drepanopeziza brunnea f. sp. 'monogermtubi']|nr:hypothetical protein LZ554_000263 [Drepanopeziza brunnea f. sp. 'monogermtubi']